MEIRKRFSKIYTEWIGYTPLAILGGIFLFGGIMLSAHLEIVYKISFLIASIPMILGFILGMILFNIFWSKTDCD